MSYGDNKANEKEVSLNILQNQMNILLIQVNYLKNVACTRENVLQLAISSQELTDTANQLYEQMKG
jgi:hypothetical protein